MNILDDMNLILAQNNINLYGIMDYSCIKEEMFLPCRAKSRLPQNAKRVIVCAFPYYINLDNKNGIKQNVCRYAVFKDYHVVLSDILNDIATKLSKTYFGKFECFCDNSPLPEIFCALQAGIGFKGKNNLLITDEYGSYVLLGCIVTDCDFPLSVPLNKQCFSCGKCINACPTHALKENFFDVSACLSQITQKKGELSNAEEQAVTNGGLVWGCDRCQEICPHNSNIKETTIPQFLESIEPHLSFENLDILIKSRPYGYRGKSLLKRNLSLIENRLV